MAKEKNYQLDYEGDEIQELLDRVNERRVYSRASVQHDGVMSSTDKTKLDSIETLTNLEIDELLN